MHSPEYYHPTSFMTIVHPPSTSMHLMIFIVACFYVGFNAVVLVMTYRYAKRIDKIANKQGDQLLDYIDSSYAVKNSPLLSAIYRSLQRSLGNSQFLDMAFVYVPLPFPHPRRIVAGVASAIVVVGTVHV